MVASRAPDQRQMPFVQRAIVGTRSIVDRPQIPVLRSFVTTFHQHFDVCAVCTDFSLAW
jgi:hypothetical protein